MECHLLVYNEIHFLKEKHTCSTGTHDIAVFTHVGYKGTKADNFNFTSDDKNSIIRATHSGSALSSNAINIFSTSRP